MHAKVTSMPDLAISAANLDFEEGACVCFVNVLPVFELSRKIEYGMNSTFTLVSFNVMQISSERGIWPMLTR